MTTSTLSGLQTLVQIGLVETDRAPRIEIVSERHSPLSRASVDLPDPKGELVQAIQTGQSVSIVSGYRNSTAGNWNGTVSAVESGQQKDQIRIHCVCSAFPLVRVAICQTWEWETPEAVLSWAVQQTGLSVDRIDSTGVQLRHIAASTLPVWQLAVQVAQSVQRAVGMDMSRWALWLGAEGVNWGDFDEPGDVPEISTGAGLIRHNLYTGQRHGLGKVETFLLPDLMHSRLFRIVDSRRGIDAERRALRVEHAITPYSARTFLWYGAEYGRY